jgi:hypothetical protein
MRKLPFILSAALACAAVSAANAGDASQGCTKAPESQWLKISDIQAKVEAQGYKVSKAKMKKTCVELYATDKGGQKLELFADPTDGKIVETKND